MSDYTLVNFSDAEDMAGKHGLGPDLEARFLRSKMNSEHLGVGHFKLAPNFRAPFGHKHEVQEEAYVIQSGSGRFKLEDEIIDVRQGDVLRVAAPVMRGFEAGPEGMEIIAIGSDRPEDGDGDIVPGWWAD